MGLCRNRQRAHVGASGCPLEVREQAPQRSARTAKTVIMRGACEPMRLTAQARLGLVKLPRVKVHDGRLSLNVQARNRPAHEAVVPEAHVKSAAERYVEPGQVHGRNGQLPQRRPQRVREASRARHAVAIVVHWKNTRIVLDILLSQVVQRPTRLPGDRKEGRTMTT